MMREFGLASTNVLADGMVAEAFNQALARCVSDCDDRPAVKKPRTITLQLQLVPRVDETGALHSVEGAFEITERTPTRKSNVFDFAVTRRADGKKLVFNDMSEDNAHQMTIDEMTNDD